MESITVHVVNRGRKFLYLRFVDPATRKPIERSSGCTTRKAALLEAGKWQAELREGRYKPASKVTWAEFRARYENEALPSLAENTAGKVLSMFNSIEKHVSPARLADLTAERIVTWQQALRDKHLSEATIKSYSAHLKAALRWAADIKLLATVPRIRMPQRAKNQRVMKGRPLTTEEFEKLLAALPKVVGTRRAPSWEFLLRGLWWSGLRITEALTLRWDGHGLTVDMTGKRPMLRIPAEAEKGNRSRVLPLAPEAAEMLQAVPEDERTGFVFNPAHKWHQGGRLKRMAVIRTISRIGQKALVKVNSTMKGGTEVVKWASAHDLRRAFGERWAQRVMPPVLQQLMRHAEISTTMRYYTGRDAETTAELLYGSLKSDTGSDSDQKAERAASSESTQPVAS